MYWKCDVNASIKEERKKERRKREKKKSLQWLFGQQLNAAVVLSICKKCYISNQVTGMIVQRLVWCVSSISLQYRICVYAYLLCCCLWLWCCKFAGAAQFSPGGIIVHAGAGSSSFLLVYSESMSDHIIIQLSDMSRFHPMLLSLSLPLSPDSPKHLLFISEQNRRSLLLIQWKKFSRLSAADTKALLVCGQWLNKCSVRGDVPVRRCGSDEALCPWMGRWMGRPLQWREIHCSLSAVGQILGNPVDLLCNWLSPVTGTENGEDTAEHRQWWSCENRHNERL